VGAKLTPEGVIAFCRGAIADYKVPRRLQVVEDFPRTSTNKIQRYLLQQEVTRLTTVKRGEFTRRASPTRPPFRRDT
jgi:acyl-coenzyme A synthetase/AMP-(fatty) acid ligase